MEKEKLRLAIVDDHPLVRNGFERQLESWPFAGEIHQAADGVCFEELCRTVGHFDIAVVDLSMPRRDGYETTKWCTRHHPRTKVLALSFDVDVHNTTPGYGAFIMRYGNVLRCSRCLN